MTDLKWYWYERVGWLLHRDAWEYLLERRGDPSVPWWRVICCRWRGHPAGVIWYNSGGLEPDMTCKECGDDLG